MKRILKIQLAIASLLFGTITAQEKAVPIFKDGQAQIVKAFNTPNKWIRHDLWVETELQELLKEVQNYFGM